MTPKSSKKLSLLIASVFERRDHLTRLLAALVPQAIDSLDRVELLISSDNKQKPIGEKRQELLEHASGEYVCFIDDDDMVSDEYVKKVLPLLDGVDYIGFRLQLYLNGKPQKPTVHSIRFGGVSEDDGGYYRDISHLNPIKRSIALAGFFGGGNKEDDRWASAIREKGLVKTEHFIDEVMYHYYFDEQRSLFVERG